MQPITGKRRSQAAIRDQNKETPAGAVRKIAKKRGQGRLTTRVLRRNIPD
jgi:hypothetical protein